MKYTLRCVFEDRSFADEYWKKRSDKTGLCYGYYPHDKYNFFVEEASKIVEYLYHDDRFVIYQYGPGVSRLVKETYETIKQRNNDYSPF